MSAFFFSCDFLTIYDGDSITVQSFLLLSYNYLDYPVSDYYDYDYDYYFSDSSLPNSLISSTNSVLIHFESDFSGTRSGFQLEYHQYST